MSITPEPTLQDFQALAEDFALFVRAHSEILLSEPRIANPLREAKDVADRKWKEAKDSAGVTSLVP
jgi:hypothetical protein